MALVCVYVRKANYFQQGKKILLTRHFSIFTPYDSSNLNPEVRIRRINAMAIITIENLQQQQQQ